MEIETIQVEKEQVDDPMSPSSVITIISKAPILEHYNHDISSGSLMCKHCNLAISLQICLQAFKFYKGGYVEIRFIQLVEPTQRVNISG